MEECGEIQRRRLRQAQPFFVFSLAPEFLLTDSYYVNLQ